MKKRNCQVKELDGPIVLDGFQVQYVVFDLWHINYGWDKERKDYRRKRRSYFDMGDVIELFKMTDNLLRDWESAFCKETFEKYRYVYNAHKGKSRYRLVVDIKKNSPNVATVVTLYRV